MTGITSCISYEYMKNLIHLVLLIFLSHISITSSAGENEKCLNKYFNHKSVEVQKTGRFLSDALDDCDYDSMDEMVFFVRNAKTLPSWSDDTLADPLQCAISDVVRDNIKFYCRKILNFKKLQKRILYQDLPKHLNDNPYIADQIPGWR